MNIVSLCTCCHFSKFALLWPSFLVLLSICPWFSSSFGVEIALFVCVCPAHRVSWSPMVADGLSFPRLSSLLHHISPLEAAITGNYMSTHLIFPLMSLFLILLTYCLTYSQYNSNLSLWIHWAVHLQFSYYITYHFFHNVKVFSLCPPFSASLGQELCLAKLRCGGRDLQLCGYKEALLSFG